jgi:hypothetical protein
MTHNQNIIEPKIVEILYYLNTSQARLITPRINKNQTKRSFIKNTVILVKVTITQTKIFVAIGNLRKQNYLTELSQNSIKNT